MTDLKPCPFCSAPAEMDTRQAYVNICTGRVETSIAIYCTECGVQAILCRGDIPDLEPEEVVAIWNRRAAPKPSSTRDEADQ